VVIAFWLGFQWTQCKASLTILFDLELMMPTSLAKYVLCKIMKCLILCWERISFHRQPLLYKWFHNNAFLWCPWYRKTCLANCGTGLSNGIIFAVASMKCATLIKLIEHWSSRVWPRTAFGNEAEEPFDKITTVFPISFPQVETPR